MKRSSISLPCNVDMPASSCSSNISKTDASILPDTCSSVSSSGVFTMSGDRHLRETHMRRRELHLHDVVEGQGRIGFSQHADLHPELGLRIDGPAHHCAGPTGFLMQVVVDFHYAHRSEEHTSELQSLMRISYAVFCFKKKSSSNKINA